MSFAVGLSRNGDQSADTSKVMNRKEECSFSKAAAG